MNIQKRLEAVRQFSGLSVNGFANKIGVSRPRLANYLLDRDPDFEVLSRICQVFPEINSEWLLTGIGKMEKETSDNISYTDDLGDKGAVKMILERDEMLIRENERMKIHVAELERKLGGNAPSPKM